MGPPFDGEGSLGMRLKLHFAEHRTELDKQVRLQHPLEQQSRSQ
jgi:hypothetical protein